jgi:hypothetical protein
VIYALAYFRMLNMFPNNQIMKKIACFWQDEHVVVWERKYKAAYYSAAHKTADKPPLAVSGPNSGPVTSMPARLSSQITCNANTLEALERKMSDIEQMISWGFASLLQQLRTQRSQLARIFRGHSQTQTLLPALP